MTFQLFIYKILKLFLFHLIVFNILFYKNMCFFQAKNFFKEEALKLTLFHFILNFSFFFKTIIDFIF